MDWEMLLARVLRTRWKGVPYCVQSHLWAFASIWIVGVRKTMRKQNKTHVCRLLFPKTSVFLFFGAEPEKKGLTPAKIPCQTYFSLNDNKNQASEDCNTKNAPTFFRVTRLGLKRWQYCKSLSCMRICSSIKRLYYAHHLGHVIESIGDQNRTVCYILDIRSRYLTEHKLSSITEGTLLFKGTVIDKTKTMIVITFALFSSWGKIGAKI